MDIQHLGEFLAMIRQNMLTFVFIALFTMIGAALIRLHFSQNYKNFDLATMFTKRDGALDMGKFRVTVVFFGTTYALFYILHHNIEAFTTYASFYVALWLSHQVVDKVTRTDKDKDTYEPAMPPPTKTPEALAARAALLHTHTPPP